MTDKMRMPLLRVTLEGKAIQEGAVRADLLAGILEDLQSLVNRIALVLTGKATSGRTGAFPRDVREACALNLVGIERGSVTIALELAAFPALDDEGLGNRSVSMLVEGVSSMEAEEPTLPREFDPGVVEGLHKLSTVLDTDVERLGLEYRSAKASRRASMAKPQRDWLAQRVNRSATSTGDVRGSLREIDLERKRCQVYLADGSCVRCTYAPELERELVRGLDHEVVLFGVSRSRQGEDVPREFEIRELRMVGEARPPELEVLTARKLIATGLGGLWAGRVDLVDSIEFADELRRRASRREGHP